MTTDDRVAGIDYRVASLEEVRRYNEARIGLLESISERQQHLLEEVRRDSQHTQRLWVRLCKKHGWLEDEDLFSNGASHG